MVSVPELLSTSSRRIAEYLELTHCLLVEIDAPAGLATVLHEYHATEVARLKAVHRMRDFHSEEQLRLMASGEPLVFDDIQRDPRTAGVPRQRLMALGTHALLNASYVENGQWKFALSAQRNEPYAWSPEDISLLTELAARLYPHFERARNEEALREQEAILRTVTTEARVDEEDDESADRSGLRPEIRRPRLRSEASSS